jgi:hypothetical protein
MKKAASACCNSGTKPPGITEKGRNAYSTLLPGIVRLNLVTAQGVSNITRQPPYL